MQLAREAIVSAGTGTKLGRWWEADEEICGFFTSSVGIKAQNYEGGNGATFDSNAMHAAKLKTMGWMTKRRSDIEQHMLVEVTLMQLHAEDQRVARLVYTPHAWPSWLASALSVPWGHGSLVALAAVHPMVTERARKQTDGSIIGWMLAQGREESFWRKVKEVTERSRLHMLRRYDEIRTLRDRADDAERRAEKAHRRAENQRLLEEVLRKP